MNCIISVITRLVLIKKIEKISDKKIKMIIFKEHFNDISMFNLKSDCTYNYIEFKDNRQTRIFFFMEKKYSYIYFENGDLIKCFDYNMSIIKEKISLSVIIPCFNEVDTIEQVIKVFLMLTSMILK